MGVLVVERTLARLREIGSVAEAFPGRLEPVSIKRAGI
jgi:hypothetical protein